MYGISSADAWMAPALHKKIADAAETAADLGLMLTDPDAIYYAEPVNSRLPGTVVIVLGGVIFAGMGLITTDLLTSPGPEPWAAKWQNAVSHAGFRAWLLFLSLTMVELLACQLSSRVRHFVRGLTHGARFAGVEGESQL